MKRSIEIALKNKPSIIKPLYDKMKSLGVSESNLTVREDMPLSFTATAHLQRSSAKQEVALGTFSKTEDGLSPDYTVQDAVPERYWRLGALSVPILMRILPYVEESTLSCANLRCMKCSETTTKDCLLKMIDFASGLCEDFALVGRFRCVVAIANLAVSRAFDRGRRALDLPLPRLLAGHPPKVGGGHRRSQGGGGRRCSQGAEPEAATPAGRPGWKMVWRGFRPRRP